jgi:hypothetical protein
MCGVASRFANVRNGWSSGNGSWSKTSMAAPAIFWALSAAIRLDHDRSARRVHQSGCGFHDRELKGADETARPTAEDEVDGDDIRPPEQFLLGDQLGAHFRCALGRQILTPGNHIHAECLADLCHRTADVTETQDTERPPGHVIADRLLPSAAAQ